MRFIRRRKVEFGENLLALRKDKRKDLVSPNFITPALAV
jgi:hypothetical protein